MQRACRPRLTAHPRRWAYQRTWQSPSLASHQLLDRDVTRRQLENHKALARAGRPLVNYFRDAFRCSPLPRRATVGAKGAVSAYAVTRLMSSSPAAMRWSWCTPWDSSAYHGSRGARASRHGVVQADTATSLGGDVLDAAVTRLVAHGVAWDVEDGVTAPALVPRRWRHLSTHTSLHTPHHTTAISSNTDNSSSSSSSDVMAVAPRTTSVSHGSDADDGSEALVIDGCRVCVRSPRPRCVAAATQRAWTRTAAPLAVAAATTPQRPLRCGYTGVAAVPSLVLDVTRGPLVTRSSSSSNSSGGSSSSASRGEAVLTLRWRADNRQASSVHDVLQLRRSIGSVAVLGLSPRAVLLLLASVATTELHEPALDVALTLAVAEHYHGYHAVECVELLRCLRRIALVHTLPTLDVTHTTPPHHDDDSSSTSSSSSVEEGGVPLYTDATIMTTALAHLVRDAAPLLVHKVWSSLPEHSAQLLRHGRLLDWLDLLALAVELAGDEALPRNLPNAVSNATHTSSYLFLRYTLGLDEALLRTLVQQLRPTTTRAAATDDVDNSEDVDECRHDGDVALTLWLCAALLVRLAAESVGHVLHHVADVLARRVHSVVAEAQAQLQQYAHLDDDDRSSSSSNTMTAAATAAAMPYVTSPLVDGFCRIGQRQLRRMRVRLVPYNAFPRVARTLSLPYGNVAAQTQARVRARTRQTLRQARRCVRAPLTAALCRCAQTRHHVGRACDALRWATSVLHHAHALVARLPALEQVCGGSASSSSLSSLSSLSLLPTSPARCCPVTAAAAEAEVARRRCALCYVYVRSRVQQQLDALFVHIAWQHVEEQLPPLSSAQACGNNRDNNMDSVCSTNGDEDNDSTTSSSSSSSDTEAERHAEHEARALYEQLLTCVDAFQLAVSDVLEAHECSFAELYATDKDVSAADGAEGEREYVRSGSDAVIDTDSSNAVNDKDDGDDNGNSSSGSSGGLWAQYALQLFADELHDAEALRSEAQRAQAHARECAAAQATAEADVYVRQHFAPAHGLSSSTRSVSMRRAARGNNNNNSMMTAAAAGKASLSATQPQPFTSTTSSSLATAAAAVSAATTLRSAAASSSYEAVRNAERDRLVAQRLAAVDSAHAAQAWRQHADAYDAELRALLHCVTPARTAALRERDYYAAHSLEHYTMDDILATHRTVASNSSSNNDNNVTDTMTSVDTTNTTAATAAAAAANEALRACTVDAVAFARAYNDALLHEYGYRPVLASSHHGDKTTTAPTVSSLSAQPGGGDDDGSNNNSDAAAQRHDECVRAKLRTHKPGLAMSPPRFCVSAAADARDGDDGNDEDGDRCHGARAQDAGGAVRAADAVVLPPIGKTATAAAAMATTTKATLRTTQQQQRQQQQTRTAAAAAVGGLRSSRVATATAVAFAATFGMACTLRTRNSNSKGSSSKSNDTDGLLRDGFTLRACTQTTAALTLRFVNRNPHRVRVRLCAATHPWLHYAYVRIAPAAGGSRRGRTRHEQQQQHNSDSDEADVVTAAAVTPRASDNNDDVDGVSGVLQLCCGGYVDVRVTYTPTSLTRDDCAVQQQQQQHTHGDSALPLSLHTRLSLGVTREHNTRSRDAASQWRFLHVPVHCSTQPPALSLQLLSSSSSCAATDATAATDGDDDGVYAFAHTLVLATTTMLYRLHNSGSRVVVQLRCCSARRDDDDGDAADNDDDNDCAFCVTVVRSAHAHTTRHHGSDNDDNNKHDDSDEDVDDDDDGDDDGGRKDVCVLLDAQATITLRVSFTPHREGVCEAQLRAVAYDVAADTHTTTNAADDGDGAALPLPSHTQRVVNTHRFVLRGVGVVPRVCITRIGDADTRDVCAATATTTTRTRRLQQQQQALQQQQQQYADNKLVLLTTRDDDNDDDDKTTSSSLPVWRYVVPDASPYATTVLPLHVYNTCALPLRCCWSCDVTSSSGDSGSGGCGGGVVTARIACATSTTGTTTTNSNSSSTDDTHATALSPSSVVLPAHGTTAFVLQLSASSSSSSSAVSSLLSCVCRLHLVDVPDVTRVRNARALRRVRTEVLQLYRRRGRALPCLPQHSNNNKSNNSNALADVYSMFVQHTRPHDVVAHGDPDGCLAAGAYVFVHTTSPQLTLQPDVLDDTTVGCAPAHIQCRQVRVCNTRARPLRFRFACDAAVVTQSSSSSSSVADKDNMRTTMTASSDAAVVVRCTPASGVVAAHDSVSVAVEYTVVALGHHCVHVACDVYDDVSAHDDDNNNDDEKKDNNNSSSSSRHCTQTTLQLRVCGVAPAVVVTPPHLSLGLVALGEEVSAAVTLHNTHLVPIDVDAYDATALTRTATTAALVDEQQQQQQQQCKLRCCPAHCRLAPGASTVVTVHRRGVAADICSSSSSHADNNNDATTAAAAAAAALQPACVAFAVRQGGRVTMLETWATVQQRRLRVTAASSSSNDNNSNITTMTAMRQQQLQQQPPPSPHGGTHKAVDAELCYGVVSDSVWCERALYIDNLTALDTTFTLTCVSAPDDAAALTLQYATQHRVAGGVRAHRLPLRARFAQGAEACSALLCIQVQEQHAATTSNTTTSNSSSNSVYASQRLLVRVCCRAVETLSVSVDVTECNNSNNRRVVVVSDGTTAGEEAAAHVVPAMSMTAYVRALLHNSLTIALAAHAAAAAANDDADDTEAVHTLAAAGTADDEGDDTRVLTLRPYCAAVEVTAQLRDDAPVCTRQLMLHVRNYSGCPSSFVAHALQYAAFAHDDSDHAAAATTTMMTTTMTSNKRSASQQQQRITTANNNNSSVTRHSGTRVMQQAPPPQVRSKSNNKQQQQQQHYTSSTTSSDAVAVANVVGPQSVFFVTATNGAEQRARARHAALAEAQACLLDGKGLAVLLHTNDDNDNNDKSNNSSSSNNGNNSDKLSTSTTNAPYTLYSSDVTSTVHTRASHDLALPPHASVRVPLTLLCNLPGCYRDTLRVCCRTATPTTTAAAPSSSSLSSLSSPSAVLVPLTVHVTGRPVLLDSNTSGVTHAGSRRTLAMPPVIAGVGTSRRTVRLVNRTPRDVAVRVQTAACAQPFCVAAADAHVDAADVTLRLCDLSTEARSRVAARCGDVRATPSSFVMPACATACVVIEYTPTSAMTGGGGGDGDAVAATTRQTTSAQCSKEDGSDCDDEDDDEAAAVTTTSAASAASAAAAAATHETMWEGSVVVYTELANTAYNDLFLVDEFYAAHRKRYATTRELSKTPCNMTRTTTTATATAATAATTTMTRAADDMMLQVVPPLRTRVLGTAVAQSRTAQRSLAHTRNSNNNSSSRHTHDVAVLERSMATTMSTSSTTTTATLLPPSSSARSRSGTRAVATTTTTHHVTTATAAAADCNNNNSNVIVVDNGSLRDSHASASATARHDDSDSDSDNDNMPTLLLDTHDAMAATATRRSGGNSNALTTTALHAARNRAVALTGQQQQQQQQQQHAYAMAAAAAEEEEEEQQALRAYLHTRRAEVQRDSRQCYAALELQLRARCGVPQLRVEPSSRRVWLPPYIRSNNSGSSSSTTTQHATATVSSSSSCQTLRLTNGNSATVYVSLALAPSTLQHVQQQQQQRSADEGNNNNDGDDGALRFCLRRVRYIATRVERDMDVDDDHHHKDDSNARVVRQRRVHNNNKKNVSNTTSTAAVADNDDGDDDDGVVHVDDDGVRVYRLLTADVLEVTVAVAAAPAAATRQQQTRHHHHNNNNSESRLCSALRIVYRSAATSPALSVVQEVPLCVRVCGVRVHCVPSTLVFAPGQCAHDGRAQSFATQRVTLHNYSNTAVTYALQPVYEASDNDNNKAMTTMLPLPRRVRDALLASSVCTTVTAGEAATAAAAPLPPPLTADDVLHNAHARFALSSLTGVVPAATAGGEAGRAHIAVSFQQLAAMCCVCAYRVVVDGQATATLLRLCGQSRETEVCDEATVTTTTRV